TIEVRLQTPWMDPGRYLPQSSMADADRWPDLSLGPEALMTVRLAGSRRLVDPVAESVPPLFFELLGRHLRGLSQSKICNNKRESHDITIQDSWQTTFATEYTDTPSHHP
ncbi:MAG: hypothetical protein ABFS45_15645, partial [Pseudomonadota bacterium]